VFLGCRQSGFISLRRMRDTIGNVNGLHITPWMSEKKTLNNRIKENLKPELVEKSDQTSRVVDENEVSNKPHESNLGIEDPKNSLSNRIEEKKHDLQDLIEDKRHDLQEKMEVKKQEMKVRLEDKRHEIELRIEDKKQELKVMLVDKKHEIEEKMEEKKNDIQDMIEDKRHDLQEKLEVKKHEIKVQLEDKRHEIELKIEDKRQELKEKLVDKKNEIEEKIEDKKQEISEKGEQAQSRALENIFDKFFGYLKSYGDVLKKAFPDTLVKTYRVFSNGSSSLLRDMKIYRRVNSLELTSTTSVSRSDLEVYTNLPRELVRVAPVLLVSALPFAQNIVFPLALMFPRRLLSAHFWNEEQLEQHQRDEILHREQAMATLSQKLDEMLPQAQKELLTQLVDTILTTNYQTHTDLLDLKILFSGPLVLTNIRRHHAKALANIHSFPLRGFFPRRRLLKYGRLLSAVDLAVLREGVQGLDTGALRRLSSARGFNCLDCSRDEMVRFLEDWLTVSRHLSENDLSLLLHLPCLLQRKETS